MTDQEIRDALRVDPSPEFLARVRSRIANEPAPSAWRWSWTVAAVGALAAMVLVGVVMSRPKHENLSVPDVAHAFPPAEAPAGPTRQQSGPAGSTAVGSPGPSASARPDAPRAAARLAGAQSAKAGSGPLSRDPEILIDPREGVALQRLLAGVTAGRVNLEPLARAVAQGAGARDDLHPPADIVIPLLPLTPAPGEGDRP